MSIHIKYDQEADAMYIKVLEGAQHFRTVEVSENTFFDFDKDNRLIGVELLDVSKNSDINTGGGLKVFVDRSLAQLV